MLAFLEGGVEEKLEKQGSYRNEDYQKQQEEQGSCSQKLQGFVEGFQKQDFQEWGVFFFSETAGYSAYLSGGELSDSEEEADSSEGVAGGMAAGGYAGVAEVFE